MSEAAKTVQLAGKPTQIGGEPDDPYFQNLEAQAEGLEVLAALADRHVSRDAVVLDVGANIGLSTILLSRRVSSVIAYEPSPINLRHLHQNLARNGVTNVTVHETAVSERSAELRFHEAQFGAGSQVVTSDHIAFEGIPTIAVRAITLDNQNLPPIAFIKLDVEGHEPEVLAGARGLLARDRPLIFSEVNIWCLCAFGGHSPGAYLRTLCGAFETWELDKGGVLTPISNTHKFLHDLIVFRRGITDIVLRPREAQRMPTLPELSWPKQARSPAANASAKCAASDLGALGR